MIKTGLQLTDTATECMVRFFTNKRTTACWIDFYEGTNRYLVSSFEINRSNKDQDNRRLARMITFLQAYVIGFYDIDVNRTAFINVMQTLRNPHNFQEWAMVISCLRPENHKKAVRLIDFWINRPVNRTGS